MSRSADTGVRQTAADADRLRRTKAQVIQKEYPNVAAHAFPQEFDAQFGEWARFILDAGKE